MMQLSAGYTLQGGKYLINHALGSQGLGVSYRATVAPLGQAVVIKTLNPHLRQHPEFEQLCQRFIDRARLLARSQHPSLVRVFDFFQEGGFPFVVMEFVAGQSLAELMPPGQGLAPTEALNVVRQVASALTVAHRYPLVHGNLQPKHLIRRSGTSTIVVVGFSAHAGQPELGNWPIDPDVLAYRPPEAQMHLPSADLYGLGAILYQCLSGHPPIVTDPNADLAEKLPLLPLLAPAQQQILRRVLATAPAQRPPTAEAWLALLDNPQAPPVLAQPSGSPPASPQDNPPRPAIRSIAESPAPMPRPTPIVPPIEPTRPPAPTFAPAPFLTEPLPLASDPSPKPTPEAAIPPATVAIKPVVTIAPSPVPSPISPSPMISRSPYPKRAFVITGTIAAMLGIGFGLALRFSAGNQPGSSLFHAGQSFPKREWKGTLQPTEESNDTIPTESRNLIQPNPSRREDPVRFPEPIESPLPRRDLDTSPPDRARSFEEDMSPTAAESPRQAIPERSSRSSNAPTQPIDADPEPAPPADILSDPAPPKATPQDSFSDPAPPAPSKSLTKGDTQLDPQPPAIGNP